MAHTFVQPTRFRKVLGWATGLSVFVALNLAALLLVKSIGLPVDFDHERSTIHWGRGAESDSEGGVMTYVLALIVASAMAAYRVGLVVRAGVQRARFDLRESAKFNVWFAGLLAFASASAGAQYSLSDIGQPLAEVASVASAALIAFVCHGWWKQRMRDIDDDEAAAQRATTLKRPPRGDG